MVSFDSVKELQRTYDVLKVGARILTSMTQTTYSHGFVSLVDPYDIRWELMVEN